MEGASGNKRQCGLGNCQESKLQIPMTNKYNKVSGSSYKAPDQCSKYFLFLTRSLNSNICRLVDVSQYLRFWNFFLHFWYCPKDLLSSATNADKILTCVGCRSRNRSNIGIRYRELSKMQSFFSWSRLIRILIQQYVQCWGWLPQTPPLLTSFRIE